MIFILSIPNGDEMPSMDLSQRFHLTAKFKPRDYQECLVYSPCEGFMIATWKQLNDEPPGFYLFAAYEAMDPEQTVFWAELPEPEDMFDLYQALGEGVLS